MPHKLMVPGLRYPEPTLQQEIGSLGDDDLMEFMNLSARRTGVEGTIFVSTKMGGHGPRVKYFEKPGDSQPSFSVSISSEPEVLSNSLPERVCNRMAPLVIAWVRQNHAALNEFWRIGTSWSDDEVTAFKDTLLRLN
jgi:hypothetical protein